jgi:hypothetical protein
MVQTSSDWGVPARTHPRLGIGLGIAVALAAAAAIVFGAVAALAGLPPWIGAAAGLVVVGGFAAALGRLALRRAGATRVAPEELPRLASLARGLSDDLGIRAPELFVYEGRGPNALVCGRAIAVSRSALTDLNRTELEALVAHCLVRLDAGSTRIATLASMGGAIARSLGVIVGPLEDARAAELTRYPPALVAALDKAEPVSGRYGPFYFVAEGPSHAPVGARIESLSEL